MYMGELVRLVAVKLIRAGLLFDGKMPTRFNIPHEFYTKFVSEIESEQEDEFSLTKEILVEMGASNPTKKDCEIVRYVCELISRRAAQLVSAALAVLILRIGDQSVTIGVDGSVYRFHPKFHEMMTQTIKDLIPPNYKFQFVLSEDGSGRGAAITASIVARALENK
jgi:hexokinase